MSQLPLTDYSPEGHYTSTAVRDMIERSATSEHMAKPGYTRTRPVDVGPCMFCGEALMEHRLLYKHRGPETFTRWISDGKMQCHELERRGQIQAAWHQPWFEMKEDVDE